MWSTTGFQWNGDAGAGVATDIAYDCPDLTGAWSKRNVDTYTSREHGLLGASRNSAGCTWACTDPPHIEVQFGPDPWGSIPTDAGKEDMSILLEISSSTEA